MQNQWKNFKVETYKYICTLEIVSDYIKENGPEEERPEELERHYGNIEKNKIKKLELKWLSVVRKELDSGFWCAKCLENRIIPGAKTR